MGSRKLEEFQALPATGSGSPARLAVLIAQKAFLAGEPCLKRGNPRLKKAKPFLNDGLDCVVN